MNNNVPISIGMTTYNGEKYLKKQLDSIITQTHKNIEIIICDDCSTDNTVNIIKEYLKQFNFIKLYINKKNLGYARNFEKAIKLSSSKYIALSDQDDIWEPQKLELLLKNIQKEENNIDLPLLIHSDLTMINDEDKIFNTSYFKYRKYKLKKEKDLGHILGPCGVMGNTIMFNKALKEKILPFPVYIENHDYWISLINEIFGKRITLDNKLVKYRIHTTNVSNNSKKIQNNKKLKNIIKSILERNFYIPYIKTNRLLLISYILKNYNLPKNDKIVLIKFQEYLSKETSSIKKIYNVIKYSFYKRDLFYRIIFILGLLLKKDISKKNFYIYNISQIFKSKNFKGWGKKPTGKFAYFCSKLFNGKLTLLEDGFIRSTELDKSLIPSFSTVKDKLGIYYDATKPSDLEVILNTYDFKNNPKIIQEAREAIDLILEHNISKYNHSENISKDYFNDEKKVLVIAQAKNDQSLKYGLTNNTTLEDIVSVAINENPDSIVYIKVHPDEIQKNSFEFHFHNKRCKIIDKDVNSISLLKYFEKVYTRTSQMGFEAVLLGKECICFGAPFYAGWGITDDRIKNVFKRRKRKLSVEEVFIGSYILYSNYKNPYTNKKSNILDIINYIISNKKNKQ